MEQKRLYRSVTNRKICGVCGGLGEYFNIDPTLVRLGWVIFGLTFGTGLLAYIICAFVISYFLILSAILLFLSEVRYSYLLLPEAVPLTIQSSYLL